jgi:hypothetical protein
MDPVWWLLRLEKGAWLRNPVEKVGVLYICSGIAHY